ncbi:hypothetical protein S40293_00518 [Stachybotrys chartarum IBT 40293]|nr:hypothetical protein S40293_00518 [Stachybotrys chartarum IBT 40293]
MVRNLIAEEDIATEYKNPQRSEPLLGLAFSRSALANAAAVKLSFRESSASSSKSGNGFFINIPGARKSVVLTAGHNLINVDTKQLHVNVSVTLLDPTAGSFVQREIPPSDIHICKSFKDNPTGSVSHPEARNDYGVILLDRGNDRPPQPAFGFSTILGDEQEIRGDVSITGTKADASGPPVTSSGACVNPIVTKNQLEYRVRTEAGMSGSVGWIGYNGLPTAVAVHNHGSEQGANRYSRGSRINHKLLSDVFQWAEVGVKQRHLRWHSPDEPQPARNLFLAYSPDDECLRAVVEAVEDDPARMLFDVWPVYAPPVVDGVDRAPLYALRCMGRWVAWNLARSEGILVDELLKPCMVRIVAEDEGDLEQGRPIKVVLDHDQALKVLTLKTGMMKRYQLDTPGEEFSGISFDDYFEGFSPDEGNFNELCLE